MRSPQRWIVLFLIFTELTDQIFPGLKKWITCGTFADYFTVAVRTGEEGSGMMGVSLLLVERDRPGVSTRPMDCMGVKGSGTAYVEFDDVRCELARCTPSHYHQYMLKLIVYEMNLVRRVPQSNYIGDVTMLLRNFVTERLGLALQANRFARICLAESIEYARRRRAFGKRLVDQPVVRYKIADMVRYLGNPPSSSLRH